MNVLLLNPYTASVYLSAQLNQYQINTYAIFTKTNDLISEYLKPDSKSFTRQFFISSTDINPILKLVENIKIDYVINGHENSVELSDRLAQILTPKFVNDPLSVRYRNNKFFMHKKLAQDNLSHIRQYIFNYLTDESSEMLQHTNFPCFIKPLFGASSLYAKKINTKEELIAFFSQLNKLDYLTRLGQDDKPEAFDFLISEFIQGDEFITDTFSKQGEHFLSSIQQNVKKTINGISFFRYTKLIKDPQLVDAIANYVNKSLTSLEFKNGFAHTEVMMNENGPCLIEVNPRISGIRGLLNHLAQLNGLNSQVDLLAKHIFNQEVKPAKGKLLHYRILYMFNFSTTVVPDYKKILTKFTTIQEVHYFKPIGYVNKSIPSALIDLAALIICGADEENILEAEACEILNLDENGFV